MSYSATSLTVSSSTPGQVTVNWSVTTSPGASFNWSLTLSGSGTISGTASGSGFAGGSGSITVTGLTYGSNYGAGYSNSVQLNLNGAAGTATIPPSNSTVVASPSYTLTWDLAGGSGGGTYPSTTSGSVSAPASTPTRSGYVFNGWSPSLPTTVSANTTITAQWLQLYTMSYDLAGGTGGNGYTSSVQSGGTVPAPSSNPTLSGKTFYAWSPSLPYSPVTGNVTFTAIWTPHTVTWNYNGGSGSPSSVSVSHGSTTTTPSTSRTDYTFNGWSGNGQSGLGQGATTAAINGDVTYTADWTYSPPPPPSNPSPTWSDSALGSFTIAAAYSDGVTANYMSGYSGAYSVSAGTLPAGIALDTSTGAVTGTPTKVSTYSFTITATNVNGAISQSFSGTVQGGVAVVTGSTWYKATVSVYSGSAWVAKPVYVYNGTSWVLSS
jgi:uncharacterized repeat protein (TIGR02543 family)